MDHEKPLAESQPAHGRLSDVAAPSEIEPNRLAQLQQAFLLEQLAADGARGKTAGDLNKEIRAAAKRDLQLSPGVASKVRRELMDSGYVETRKNGRKVTFELTESGRTYLGTLERPALTGPSRRPVTVDETAIPEVLREAQKTYLLLQLLDADGQPLTRAEANKIPKRLSTSLGLKPEIANHRRAKLVEQGYIRTTRAGRGEEYALTRDGLDYLTAGAPHLEHGEFTLKGKTLNALVAAARDSSFERERPAAVQAVPSQAQMVEAVVAEFEELRRESHGRSGLVPVHELRQRIANRFGSDSARHDTLDEVILGLWRQNRIGLLAISDLGDATEQQLNDSIQGINGTLFYLEIAREQPVIAEPIQR